MDFLPVRTYALRNEFSAEAPIAAARKCLPAGGMIAVAEDFGTSGLVVRPLGYLTLAPTRKREE